MTTGLADLTPKQAEQLRHSMRERSRTDLHYLARHVLRYDRVTGHIHKKMARQITVPGHRFKLLLWPRGHFKSTIATEAGSIHALLNDPNERILLTNVKLGNARKFMRAIMEHFRSNSLFRWIWREWWIENFADQYDRMEMGDRLDWVTRETQDEFTLLRPYRGREASITTGGVDASMVSQHYSRIICDDLINREYVRSAEMVEKSILYFRDLLDLLDPDGTLVVIGTRWSYMDLYEWIIDNFGHRATLNVPDGYISQEIKEASDQTPDDEKEWMFSIQPCFDEQGDPIFPEEYSRKVLDDLETAKGPYEFGAQYLLNPTPKSDQSFKDEWFNKLDVMPDPSALSVCITVDPAKSLQDRADRSAVPVYGYDLHNNMYLLDGLNEKLSEDELLEAIFDLACKWQDRAKRFYPIGWEAVGFQETYIHNFERMMKERNRFFSVESIKRRVSSKEERIRRLIPRVKHGFYVPNVLLIQPRTKREDPYDLTRRLIWELTRFPRAQYDDLADATADQLDIVPSSYLPRGKKGEPKEREGTFSEPKITSSHPSIVQDRRTRKYARALMDDTSGAVR